MSLMSKKNKIVEVGGEFLTFYHYKEPLKQIPKSIGYGFYGALLSTPDGKKIQCHVCGKLFTELQAHARQAHGIKNRDYKEMFQLAYRTALVSEEERMLRKEKTIAFFATLSEHEKEEIKRKSRIGYRVYRQSQITNPRTQPEIRLETKNKRGTCPDQLLEKIKEVAKHVGRNPSKVDFIDYWQSQRYVHLIYKTFGSWSKAKEMAGYGEIEQKTVKGFKKKAYSKEELLEYLQIFYQENGKVPTETDCRRGLVPDSLIYRRHFGSLPKARELAGLYDEVGRWVKHTKK